MESILGSTTLHDEECWIIVILISISERPWDHSEYHLLLY
jgi:hypothetical protein